MKICRVVACRGSLNTLSRCCQVKKLLRAQLYWFFQTFLLIFLSFLPTFPTYLFAFSYLTSLTLLSYIFYLHIWYCCIHATKGVKRGLSIVYFTISIWETTKTMYICNHSQKISNVCDTSLWLSSLLSAWLQFLMGFLSLWTSFSFFDSLDGVCRIWLTLLESEYCPTSLPTRTPEGIRYKSASPGPR